MAACTRGVFIVAAKRTPFGTFGGKLREWSATELGVAASRSALEAGKVPHEAVDSVVFGCVNQVGDILVPRCEWAKYSVESTSCESLICKPLM